MRGVVTRPTVTSAPARRCGSSSSTRATRRFSRRITPAVPSLARLGYEEQWRALMDTCFGTFDAYSHHLAAARTRGARGRRRTAGRCSAHGRRSTGFRATSEEILLAQVRAFEPDVVYVQNLHYPSDAALSDICAASRASSSVRSRASRRRLRGCGGFDLVLTSFPHFVERFRAARRRFGVLPHRLRPARRSSTRPRRSRRGRRTAPSSSARSTAPQHRRANAAPGAGRAAGADRLLGVRRCAVGRRGRRCGGAITARPGGSTCTACCGTRESRSTGTSGSRSDTRTTCGSSRRQGSDRCS